MFVFLKKKGDVSKIKTVKCILKIYCVCFKIITNHIWPKMHIIIIIITITIIIKCPIASI